MSEVTSPEAKVGYVYNFVTNISEGQQLTISGNLALGATAEEMGAEFDKMVKVTSRLIAKRAIPNLKDKITSGNVILTSAREDLKRLEETVGQRQLSQAEKQNREAYMSNIRRLETQLASDNTALEQLIKDAE